MNSAMPEKIDDLATDPFWSRILYTDGVLDPKKVANELMDYHAVWQALGEVIDEQAGSRLTGCYKLYTGRAINDAINLSRDEGVRDLIDEAVQDAIETKIENGELLRPDTSTA